MDGSVMANGRFLDSTLLNLFSDSAWISMVAAYNSAAANLYTGHGTIGNGKSEEIIGVRSTTANAGRSSINDDGDGGSAAIELIASASFAANSAAHCEFYVCI